MNERKWLLIDPSSYHFLNDELFNLDNLLLNRDGCLRPLDRLKKKAESKNLKITTADDKYLGSDISDFREYWSLGMIHDWKKLSENSKIKLEGFIILEPPIVDPKLYKSLPELTHYFNKVYVYNTHGDGYSLKGVDQSKLRKTFFPQPQMGVMENYFNQTDRFRKLVIVCGSHNPKFRKPELYSKRIESIVYFSKFDFVDFYGKGWNSTFSLRNAWWPFWSNKNILQSHWSGVCGNKFELLSRYDFSLCYENMPMDGYITEKIFDCFYAGCVPVYWGGKDIEKFIPPETYINRTHFKSNEDLFSYLKDVSNHELNEKRFHAKNFLLSEGMRKHVDFLEDIIFSV